MPQSRSNSSGTNTSGTPNTLASANSHPTGVPRTGTSKSSQQVHGGLGQTQGHAYGGGQSLGLGLGPQAYSHSQQQLQLQHEQQVSEAVDSYSNSYSHSYSSPSSSSSSPSSSDCEYDHNTAGASSSHPGTSRSSASTSGLPLSASAATLSSVPASNAKTTSPSLVFKHQSPILLKPKSRSGTKRAIATSSIATTNTPTAAAGSNGKSRDPSPNSGRVTVGSVSTQSAASSSALSSSLNLQNHHHHQQQQHQPRKTFLLRTYASSSALPHISQSESVPSSSSGAGLPPGPGVLSHSSQSVSVNQGQLGTGWGNLGAPAGGSGRSGYSGHGTERRYSHADLGYRDALAQPGLSTNAHAYGGPSPAAPPTKTFLVPTGMHRRSSSNEGLSSVYVRPGYGHGHAVYGGGFGYGGAGYEDGHGNGNGNGNGNGFGYRSSPQGHANYANPTNRSDGLVFGGPPPLLPLPPLLPSPAASNTSIPNGAPPSQQSHPKCNGKNGVGGGSLPAVPLSGGATPPLQLSTPPPSVPAQVPNHPPPAYDDVMFYTSTPPGGGVGVRAGQAPSISAPPTPFIRSSSLDLGGFAFSDAGTGTGHAANSRSSSGSALVAAAAGSVPAMANASIDFRTGSSRMGSRNSSRTRDGSGRSRSSSRGHVVGAGNSVRVGRGSADEGDQRRGRRDSSSSASSYPSLASSAVVGYPNLGLSPNPSHSVPISTALSPPTPIANLAPASISLALSPPTSNTPSSSSAVPSLGPSSSSASSASTRKPKGKNKLLVQAVSRNHRDAVTFRDDGVGSGSETEVPLSMHASSQSAPVHAHAHASGVSPTQAGRMFSPLSVGTQQQHQPFLPPPAQVQQAFLQQQQQQNYDQPTGALARSRRSSFASISQSLNGSVNGDAVTVAPSATNSGTGHKKPKTAKPKEKQRNLATRFVRFSFGPLGWRSGAKTRNEDEGDIDSADDDGQPWRRASASSAAASAASTARGGRTNAAAAAANPPPASSSSRSGRQFSLGLGDLRWRRPAPPPVLSISPSYSQSDDSSFNPTSPLSPLGDHGHPPAVHSHHTSLSPSPSSSAVNRGRSRYTTEHTHMSRDASHEGDGGDPSLKFTIDLNNFAPFLFEFSRLLSVVPALCGFFFCLWQMLPLGFFTGFFERLGGESGSTSGVWGERLGGGFDERAFVELFWRCEDVGGVGGGGTRRVCGGPPIPGRVDWFVAALWAMLTAYHCLGLSTGLLMRWKLYYSPLATLVRLLGLQGICWPATHLTLSIFGGVRRPVVAWAIVGTSTAVSRSIQIYVTSNIVWLKDKRVSSAASSNPTTTSATIPPDDTDGDGAVDNTGLFNRLAAIIGGDDLMGASSSTIGNGNGDASPQPQPYRRRERRWDWKKVGLRCILPTGLLYFIMAWAEVGRREWESQSGRYCVEFGGAASSGGGCM